MKEYLFRIILLMITFFALTACGAKEEKETATPPAVAVEPTATVISQVTPTPVPSALPAVEAPPREFRGHTRALWGVDFSPDGKTLASSGSDGTVRLWDLATGDVIRVIEDKTADFGQIWFSPDGSQLIVADAANHTALLLDVATGETVRIFSGQASGVDSVGFSPDFKTIVTNSGEEHYARIWDTESGETLHTLEVGNFVPRVAFSPDGKFVLTGSDDGILWDASTGEQVKVFEHPAFLPAVGFSPDSRYALTASDDNIVRIWDIASEDVVQEFAHDHYLNCVTFSPDGRFVATCGGSNTVSMWDVATGEKLREFSHHTGGVQTVTFSPDGRYLATAGEDSIVRVWDLQAAPVEAVSGQEADLTLHLAIPDTSGRAAEPYILEFVDQVKALSGGEMTVEILWDAGANTDEGYEHGVLAAVLDGDHELGLAASRVFEHEGITAFQPLQTPFLIDNDALAVAVANSETAIGMLDALSSSGLTGLALWPEDLRHPFSVIPGEPVLSPDDLAGQTVRTTSEGVTTALIEALGGIPELYADRYQRAEAGLLQGYSLTGRPIGTANVAYFSKYQVLFGNSDAFNGLSAEQQAILRDAAAAAQAKALAEHPGDAAAGEAWCADGGTVVLASDEQIAAFKEAAQPVYDMIEADPANAEAMAALTALKESTEPSAGAEACGEAAAAGSAGEEVTWSEGLPPNGIWQVNLTEEDVINMGVLKSNAPGWAGLSSYEFNDGEGVFRGEFLDGLVVVCPFTYEAVDDFFRLSYVDKGLENYECGVQEDDLQWRLDEEGLHLHVVTIHEGLLLENTALYEAQPWQKVEEWSEGLPPDGVYQVELTPDDFVEAGVLRSVAENEWAGIYTFTFDNGESRFEWEGTAMSAKCQATYEVVGEVVRFTYYTDTFECTDQVDDVQWRLDDDGLHWNVVEIKNAPVEVAVIYESRPWQRIGD